MLGRTPVALMTRSASSTWPVDRRTCIGPPAGAAASGLGQGAGGGGAGMCTTPMALPSFCSSVGLTAGCGGGRIDGRGAAGAAAGRSMASTRAPV